MQKYLAQEASAQNHRLILAPFISSGFMKGMYIYRTANAIYETIR